MGEVYVVVQVGDGECEVSLGYSFELASPVDLCGDMGHRLADIAWRTEGFATFLDADGPHNTGPNVHVLKTLAVDRSQVREIIGALTRKFGGLTKLGDTRLNKIVLCVAKGLRCLGAGPVPQKARAGDEVALPVPFKIRSPRGAALQARLLQVVSAPDAIAQLGAGDGSAGIGHLVGARCVGAAGTL